MDFNDIVRVVESKVLDIYNSCRGNYPSSHDFLHVKRVLNNALTIAENIGVSDYDKFLLTLACLLHDISIPLYGVKEDHAYKSAEYARYFLLDCGLNLNDIEIICNAIREHSWSSKVKSNNLISMVLQDADRLDALGIIGFARMIIYGEFSDRILYFEPEFTPRFRSIDDSNYTLDHVFSKLIHIPESMNTEFAKNIAFKRLSNLLWVVKLLEFEVKGYF
ncbi:MAG: HD domain-containing protein [Candidatus Methanomethylicia archaeon]